MGRILTHANDPLFYADWDRMLMIHYEVDPAALRPYVPFPLDLRRGKAYVTLLEGEITEPITVDQWLGPDLSAGVTVKQQVVPPESPDGQAATTVFHPLVARNGYTLAGVQLLTGRKHQIRAHADFIGHRVVGDKLYGPDPRLYLEFAMHGWTARHSELLAFTRQALHCAAIDLRPARMDYLLRAPWPVDLARFAAREMKLPADEAQRLIDAFVDRILPAPPPREAPAVSSL